MTSARGPRRVVTSPTSTFHGWIPTIDGTCLVARGHILLDGQHTINSAADAAQALRPLAGDLAGLLFALGIIGAGFLAVPILTGSAAYGVSEALGWSYGLEKKLWKAKQFYGVIAVSTLLGVAIDFLGINPIQALYWTAVINGVLAGPLLILIMLVANNGKIMGERVNNPWINLLGWAATATMLTAAVGLFLTWGTA